jgi:hypothetical protein
MPLSLVSLNKIRITKFVLINQQTSLIPAKVVLLDLPPQHGTPEAELAELLPTVTPSAHPGENRHDTGL